eukprot:6177260-Pleurochrysis_carterae.AAC.2
MRAKWQYSAWRATHICTIFAQAMQTLRVCAGLYCILPSAHAMLHVSILVFKTLQATAMLLVAIAGGQRVSALAVNSTSYWKAYLQATLY